MEPFLYLALFLLVAILTLIVRWLKGAFPEQAGESEGAEWVQAVPTPAPPADIQPPPLRGVGLVPKREPPRPAPTPTHPVGAVKRAPRVTVGGSEDLRRGIVLMTILGPCRGLDHPEAPGRYALRVVKGTERG